MAVIFGIDWFLLLTPDVMHDAFVPDFFHLMLGNLPAARRKVEILLFKELMQIYVFLQMMM